MKHKGRHKHKKSKNLMKQLPDVIVEVQALATISEDQFEAALATVVSDLQALQAGAGKTITSVVINFSDSSTEEFDPKA